MNNYGMDLYQQYIYKSRYARWLWDENRREDWPETVKRYFDFFENKLKKDHNHDIKPYRKELEEAVLNLEVMPSMRCLMTAGPALEKESLSGFNCSYIAVNRMQSFDEILYILMNGVGVGFSVEQHEISNLPVVVDSFHHSDTIIHVADSKLGWAKAFRELISLLYNGQIPKWDISKVRPAGAPLKTFGGRASGPEPLVGLFQFTVDVFKKAAGRKLTSLECHDIVCKTAEIVVVGGVRRSALISLSDLQDDRLRVAKSGQWWSDNAQRALANNTAVYKEKPDIGTFMTEWKALYDSKSGERGMFNRQSAKKSMDAIGRRSSDYSFGLNPCLVGDTEVETSAGIMTMKELSDISSDELPLAKSYNIDTGEIEFQPIVFSGKTKENANIIELEIEKECGEIVKLSLTPDHLVFTENRGYIKAALLEDTDIIVFSE